MKLSKEFTLVVFIFSVISIFLVTNNLYAQENSNKKIDKTVIELTTKLQQKLLLTDEQVKSVEKILISYEADPTNDNFVKAKKNIQVMFDPRQKAKYEIINVEWWNSVRTELGTKK